MEPGTFGSVVSSILKLNSFESRFSSPFEPALNCKPNPLKKNGLKGGGCGGHQKENYHSSQPFGINPNTIAVSSLRREVPGPKLQC